MTPLISIITPVFNGSRFIECCIMNVVAQNCPDVEHIIIDGGSNDGTVEIIKTYAERYKHIKWLSGKDNGQSDAMNKGVRLACGSILGILNVDDYYESGALQKVLDIFTFLPEPSLLVGNCNVWDNDDNVWFVSKPAMINLTNLLLGKFMDAFPMNPSAYFYHKSLHEKIGLYEIDEHYGMDVHFIIKSVQLAQVKYVDMLFGNYRYLEGTKTYEEDKFDRTGARVKQIIAHYRNKQPFHYFLYLVFLDTLGNTLNLVKNTLFFLKRL